MEQLIHKASVLIEALPYIRKFDGKTVVIKYGGSAMTDPAIRKSTAEDVVLMKYVGMNPVVVHGGGPAINRTLQRLGIASDFRNGLRVTDEATIEVVEMVLSGIVNKDMVSLLNCAGGTAVGLCGKDGGLLQAEQVLLPDGTDIGHDGRVTEVRPQVINVICQAGMIPVIAPVATDAAGGAWNVNADTAAGEIAAALRAEKLVFLTDTPGLLRDKDDPATLIGNLRYNDVEALTKQGVISGGMLPKVEACMRALDGDVVRTHIIDGRVPQALLLEIFTDRGLGTLVTR